MASAVPIIRKKGPYTSGGAAPPRSPATTGGPLHYWGAAPPKPRHERDMHQTWGMHQQICCPGGADLGWWCIYAGPKHMSVLLQCCSCLFIVKYATALAEIVPRTYRERSVQKVSGCTTAASGNSAIDGQNAELPHMLHPAPLLAPSNQNSATHPALSRWSQFFLQLG
jgi:hypothetical protein